MHAVPNRSRRVALVGWGTLGVLALILCARCATTAKGTLGGAPKAGPMTLEYASFKSEQEARDMLGYEPSAHSETTPHPSEPLKAEPTYISKRPLYAAVQLGPGSPKESRFTLVFDESHGTGSGYDTCYVDANNNQDLTDDPKLTAIAHRENEARRVFPPVEVTVRYGEAAYPYHIMPTCYLTDPTYARAASACYLKGLLEVGDKQYTIALVDGDANGVFNDPTVVPEEYHRVGPVYTRGDMLLIDRDGDGKFAQSGRPSLGDMYAIGPHLALGDACYDLCIEPHGRRLTLSKTKDKCGIVALEAGNAPDGSAPHAVLVDDKGSLRVEGEQTAVPAGIYFLVTATTTAGGTDKRMWQAFGRGTWEMAPLVVEQGKVVTLTLGAPFKVRVAASPKQGDIVQLGLTIEGRGGESYSAAEIRAVGESEMPQPPKVSIADKDGKVLATGDFRYG